MSETAGATRSLDSLPLVQAGPDFFQNSPAVLARAAARLGPIFRVRFRPGLERIFLVGPEANRLVLYTHREHFSHDQGWTPLLGPYFGRGLLNMEGAEWAQHRKMMNPAFTAAYMATYLPVMRQVIAERTADWARRGEIDLYIEARRITFEVAAATLVGFERGTAQVARLGQLFFALLHPTAGLETGGAQPGDDAEIEARLAAVERDLAALLLPHIRARREATAGGPPPDVLGMLVRATDDDGRALDDAQLLAHVNILLVAGHETSTTLASWLLYLLALHPQMLDRARAEVEAVLGPAGGEVTLEGLRRMRFLQNAMTEAGRLHSPVRWGPRGVVKAFDFAGFRVPEGTDVRYAIAAGHRLPHVFAEPDRFDPDRFSDARAEDRRTPYGLVTFGGGPRICIGLNMAQVEVKALAAHVLPRVDLLPRQGAEVVQAGWTTGFPEHGIPVTARAR